MTKTKKKKQTEKLYCPYCGRMAVLRPAKHVYGSQNLDPGNYLYVCSGYPSCDSYIGVHKKTMRPMGTLANGDLRHKRIEAHRALNQVVNSGIMTKKGIYIWLQNRFGLREKICISESFQNPGAKKLPGNARLYWNNIQKESKLFQIKQIWRHEERKALFASAG